MDEISPFEPTVLGAMWRFRWLVLVIVAVVAGLSLFYGITRPLRNEATAVLVVEDPRASSLFDIGNVSRPERYVANQAAILQSTAVAERAAEIAAPDAPLLADPAEILLGLDVFWSRDGDNIGLVFTAEEPDVAVIGVNAVVTAYRELRQQTTAAGFTDALAQLDDSIADVDDQLASLQVEIDEQLAANPARQELEDQFGEAISAISEVQRELFDAPAAERPALRDQLDDLYRQLQTLQLVKSLESQQPELSALLDEQQSTVSRKADLLQRRDGLVVESRLESTGIVLEAPAIEAEEVGTDLFRSVAVGLVLGALAAAGTAYLLALRRRTFTDRSQPELILRVPMIAEVPDFSEEGLKDELPVFVHPASASAEAFRFVASAIDIAAGGALRRDGRREGGHSGRASPKVFAFVSASQGDGKSVVTANTAVAAARLGVKVLVIDTDFGSQHLTNMLYGSRESQIGITEVAELGTPLQDVVQKVDLSGGVSIDLLSRGRVEISAPDFFRTSGVQDLFTTVGREYDLVLIDIPPLLHVAYASAVLRYADRQVAVVPHGGSVSAVEELADRFAFLEADPIGYVYNRAPLREDRAHGRGSMKDVLGRADARG